MRACEAWGSCTARLCLFCSPERTRARAPHPLPLEGRGPPPHVVCDCWFHVGGTPARSLKFRRSTWGESWRGRGSRLGCLGSSSAKDGIRDLRVPLAFLTASWEKTTREEAELGRGIRPPRPFSGTEAPGTEAPLGPSTPLLPLLPAFGPRPPRLEYPTPVLPPNGGRTWMVTLDVPKSSKRTNSTTLKSFAVFLGIFVFLETSSFSVVGLDQSAHFLSQQPQISSSFQL